MKMPAIRQDLWGRATFAFVAICFTITGTATAASARFWISTTSQSTAGPDAPVPTINLPIGTTQTIYVWAQPATNSGTFKNLYNLSLNLVAAPAGTAVYDIRDTFQVNEAGGDRFQPQFIRDSNSASFPISSSWSESAVLSGNLDAIIGLSAGLAQTTAYHGIGLQQTGDNGNPLVTAWRIASVELFGVKDSGTAQLHLQVGSLGMNHAGETSVDTFVTFGSTSDPVYNAKDHREMTFPNQISPLVDAPDLIVFGVPISHPGDFDSNGAVDGADFVAWQTNFPKPTGALRSQGDADSDGDVDGADFVVWQTNFPFSPGPGITPVPEPHALLSALLATFGLLTAFNQRKRTAAIDQSSRSADSMFFN